MPRDDLSAWTPFERLRREWLDADGCAVLAHLEHDRHLVAWAQTTGRFVRIDRRTPWGNPFHITSRRTRREAVAAYRRRWATQPALQAALPTLQGKVLGCWCAPKRCHGEVLLWALDPAAWQRYDAWRQVHAPE